MEFYKVTLLLLVGTVFISPVFADINEIVILLPTTNNLPSWEISEARGGNNMEIEISELKPNVVNQKFVLYNESSSMSVELNILEFDSNFETAQTYKKYVKFLSENFDRLELGGEQSSSCYGITNNFGYVNEMATITCTRDSFLVISTAQQQGGGVFDNGQQILSERSSAAFMTHILAEIDKNSELQVPEWIKNNALWWGQDKISDNEFMSGLQYLIQNNIIVVNETTTSIDSGSIPYWIKNTALWWGQDKISDEEFVMSIEFLIENSFITI